MDRLNAEAIKRAAQMQLIGQEIDVQGEVDSTNAALLRRTCAGALEGTVVIADSQTAARAPGQTVVFATWRESLPLSITQTTLPHP